MIVQISNCNFHSHLCSHSCGADVAPDAKQVLLLIFKVGSLFSAYEQGSVNLSKCLGVTMANLVACSILVFLSFTCDRPLPGTTVQAYTRKAGGGAGETLRFPASPPYGIAISHMSLPTVQFTLAWCSLSRASPVLSPPRSGVDIRIGSRQVIADLSRVSWC